MNWDVYQDDIFSHCNVDQLVSQLSSLVSVNDLNPSNVPVQTHLSFKHQQIHQQTFQTTILNDPMTDGSLNIQQQSPLYEFDINTNTIQQFQDQQAHSTTKPVCALLVFGILLFIFNVLVERATLRVPIAGPDCSVRLELLLYLIYAGLEIFCIYLISNSNLVFHIFDFFFLFFRSRIENKIVYVLLQASTSSKPVWRMLLLGIILCGFIIWLFFSLLHGGLRPTVQIDFSPNEKKYPFLINAFYFTIILIIFLFFSLFLVLFFKLVKNNKENTKVKIKDR